MGRTASDSQFSAPALIPLSDAYLLRKLIGQNPFLLQLVQYRKQVSVAGTASLHVLCQFLQAKCFPCGGKIDGMKRFIAYMNQS